MWAQIRYETGAQGQIETVATHANTLLYGLFSALPLTETDNLLLDLERNVEFTAAFTTLLFTLQLGKFLRYICIYTNTASCTMRLVRASL
jgi:hypothetical protein